MHSFICSFVCFHIFFYFNFIDTKHVVAGDSSSVIATLEEQKTFPKNKPSEVEMHRFLVTMNKIYIYTLL